MRITTGIFGACLLVLGAYSANAQNYTETTTIPGGVKVCSAVVPSNWRNDLPVPRAWTQAMCNAWAAAIGASGQNYACLTDSGMKYNSGGGSWNTCGW
jgi:hypothetical protein